MQVVPGKAKLWLSSTESTSEPSLGAPGAYRGTLCSEPFLSLSESKRKTTASGNASLGSGIDKVQERCRGSQVKANQFGAPGRRACTTGPPRAPPSPVLGFLKRFSCCLGVQRAQMESQACQQQAASPALGRRLGLLHRAARASSGAFVCRAPRTYLLPALPGTGTFASFKVITPLVLSRFTQYRMRSSGRIQGRIDFLLNPLRRLRSVVNHLSESPAPEQKDRACLQCSLSLPGLSAPAPGRGCRVGAGPAMF